MYLLGCPVVALVDRQSVRKYAGLVCRESFRQAEWSCALMKTLEVTSSPLLRYSPNRYELATHDIAADVAQSTPEVVVNLTTVSFKISSLQGLEVH